MYNQSMLPNGILFEGVEAAGEIAGDWLNEHPLIKWSLVALVATSVLAGVATRFL